MEGPTPSSLLSGRNAIFEEELKKAVFKRQQHQDKRFLKDLRVEAEAKSQRQNQTEKQQNEKKREEKEK